MEDVLRRYEDVAFEQLSGIEQNLVEKALQERDRNHSIEGVALLGSDGRIYLGHFIQHAHGTTHSIMYALNSIPDMVKCYLKISKVAVVGSKDISFDYCYACRDLLQEYRPADRSIELIDATPEMNKGVLKAYLDDLLPF